MSQPQEKEYKLSNFSKEEGEAVIVKLNKFLEENSAELAVTPIINQNGTVGAKLEIFKKVELVPKGVATPFMEGGKFVGDESNKPDTDAGSEGTRPVEPVKA